MKEYHFLELKNELVLNLQGQNPGMQTFLIGRDRNYVSGLQIRHFQKLMKFVQRGQINNINFAYISHYLAPLIKKSLNFIRCNIISVLLSRLIPESSKSKVSSYSFFSGLLFSIDSLISNGV